MRVKTACACLFFASAFLFQPPRASADGDEARRALVVAKVGKHAITLGELESRLAAVPRFQLTTFGATAEEIRKNFLQTILVPEALYAEAAEAAHVDESPLGQHEKKRVLAEAAVRGIKAPLPKARDLTAEQLKQYFEEHRARYEVDEAILVWRIRCKTREEAITVLEAVKKTPTIDTFGALAREHSLDKSTSLRNGNVGFLSPDGTSNEAGLKIDPAVVKAASAVKDGELVKDPVKEGDLFAVVWRRGTRPASKKNLQSVEPQVRDSIVREAGEKEVEKVLADLKAKHVKDIDLLVLNLVDVRRVDGAIVQRNKGDAAAPPTK